MNYIRFCSCYPTHFIAQSFICYVSVTQHTLILFMESHHIIFTVTCVGKYVFTGKERFLETDVRTDRLMKSKNSFKKL